MSILTAFGAGCLLMIGLAGILTNNNNSSVDRLCLWITGVAFGLLVGFLIH